MIKEEVLEELKDKWFWAYLIGILGFTIIFAKVPYTSFKIIAGFGVAVSQLIYNIRIIFLKKDSFFPSFLRWSYFIILLLFVTTYTAAIVKDIMVSIILLLTAFGIIILSALVISFINLWKSKNVYLIIITYLFFAFTAIVFFGYIFSIAVGFEGSQILNSDGVELEGAWNYVSFSSSVFYTNTFGEIPLGWPKLIAHFELAFSAVIHIIVLGMIINSLKMDS